MTSFITITARLLARRLGRAILIRETSALESEREPALVIAILRLVGEQQVQAVAWGLVGQEPAVLTRWNPLARQADELEPFALALDHYLATSRVPRIWLPHRTALDTLDILAHRLQNNANASLQLRRLGAQCRALVTESGFPGQQVVAVATDVLQRHLVTGQTPTEDEHLGALLAWAAPVPGIDPSDEARRRALVPAAAMLDKDADRRVERLRGRAKGSGPGAAAARTTIEDLLREGVMREWDLVMDARAAFWALGLPPLPDIEILVKQSLDRFAAALRHGTGVPSRPAALIRRLLDMEAATALAEDLTTRGDHKVREQRRATGRVIQCHVVAVEQPRRNYHPCVLTLSVAPEQRIVRVHPGSKLQTLDAQVQGYVEDVRVDASGGTIIMLRLTKGVRQDLHLTIGADEDWVDTVYVDDFAKKGMLQAMRAANAPVVFGEHLPTDVPRSLGDANLAALAEGLRNHAG